MPVPGPGTKGLPLAPTHHPLSVQLSNPYPLGGEQQISPLPCQSGPLSYAGSTGTIGTGGSTTNTNSLQNRIHPRSPPLPLPSSHHHPAAALPPLPTGSTSGTGVTPLGRERD
ncbi:hypothetical protein AX14_001607 [Amanita brunnescens Koide BX004]|nr:hypothetical protein AX14_001607 [Amanita brunnescens Koide BX004]